MRHLKVRDYYDTFDKCWGYNIWGIDFNYMSIERDKIKNIMKQFPELIEKYLIIFTNIRT